MWGVALARSTVPLILFSVFDSLRVSRIAIDDVVFEQFSAYCKRELFSASFCHSKLDQKLNETEVKLVQSAPPRGGRGHAKQSMSSG